MRKKMIMIMFILFALTSCAPHYVITTGDYLESPKNIDTTFVPVKAFGKETITKGTEKTTNTNEFIVNDAFFKNLQSVSIEKANVKVTVAHANYNFINTNYGLLGARKHPLPNRFVPMHVWGPHDAPAFRAYYMADSEEVYQTVNIIPFYGCITDVYRNESNRKIYTEFQNAFSEGKILPFNGDKRTTQEIKEQMEGLIGEPYCTEYYKQYLVFYVKIQNFGKEKIRLWPTEDSVLIDRSNIQYKALKNDGIEFLLKPWKDVMNNLPKGKNNPVLGVHLSDLKDKKGSNIAGVVKGLAADKAGLRKNDIIIELNEKSINKSKDVNQALSNRVPGDRITAKILREGIEKSYNITLMSASEWPKPEPPKSLAGGNVYPNVIYDGYIIFDTLAMMNNSPKGSKIKLIIPLIGTEFTAADMPIHSYDFEFDFELK